MHVKQTMFCSNEKNIHQKLEGSNVASYQLNSYRNVALAEVHMNFVVSKTIIKFDDNKEIVHILSLVNTKSTLCIASHHGRENKI